MRRPRCVSVSATLAARGEPGFTDRMQSHIEACLSCRAEIAGHRRVRRELAALREANHRAPADLHQRVMTEIGPWAVPDEDIPSSLRVKVAAAAAVATAATATAAAGTAVIVLRYRHRAA
ncbi:MAG: hypothetical protein QNJ71_11725 [Acidimicrobiia bacterium]|nr:hypothetical protein [Acidimicrobiia bacterium]